MPLKPSKMDLLKNITAREASELYMTIWCEKKLLN